MADLSARMKNATDAEKPGMTREANRLVGEYNALKALRTLAKLISRDYPGEVIRLEQEIEDLGLQENQQNQKQNFNNLNAAPSHTAAPAIPDAGAAEFGLSMNASIPQGQSLAKLPGIGSIENRFNNTAAVEPVDVAPVQAAVNPLQFW